MLYRLPRWTRRERIRLYSAGLLVALARYVLLAFQRGFSLGLIDVGGIAFAVRLSERIRALGWYLVRHGRRKYRP